jgi:hypothetical protein
MPNKDLKLIDINQNNKDKRNPTPKKTTMIDPTGGRTIAYGEDVVPDWTMGKGDTGQQYIVPRSDFDDMDYSKAQKIDAPEGREYDYGNKFVMKNNKITGEASDKDVMNYPEHVSGKKAGDLGDQMMNWARSKHYENTEAERQAKQNARYQAILKADKKEKRAEKKQIRRENRN